MRAFAFFAVVLLTASLAFAQNVFHPVEELKAGIFGALVGGGNYTFNNSLVVVDKLGIGTTSPDDKLEVSGGATAYSVGAISLTGGDQTGGITPIGRIYAYYTAAGWDKRQIRFAVGQTGAIGVADAMTIAASGNVGIGTTSPTQPLEVVGSIKLSGAGGENYIMPTTNSNTIRIGDGGSYFGVQPNYGSGVVAVFTWNFERKLIFRTGNIGIGTTDPGVKLDVSGTIRGTRVEGACMPQGVAVWDSSGIAKCCAGTASYTGMPVLYICN